VDRLGLSADVALAIKSNVAVIATLEQEIGRLESPLLEGVKFRPEYILLKSIPGRLMGDPYIVDNPRLGQPAPAEAVPFHPFPSVPSGIPK
jgi:hypothetical protein